MEVHSGSVEGQYLHGANRFAVIFEIDATDKSTNERTQMKELGVYTVRDAKIVREEFFYGGYSPHQRVVDRGIVRSSVLVRCSAASRRSDGRHAASCSRIFSNNRYAWANRASGLASPRPCGHRAVITRRPSSRSGPKRACPQRRWCSPLRGASRRAHGSWYRRWRISSGRTSPAGVMEIILPQRPQSMSRLQARIAADDSTCFPQLSQSRRHQYCCLVPRHRPPQARGSTKTDDSRSGRELYSCQGGACQSSGTG